MSINLPSAHALDADRSPFEAMMTIGEATEFMQGTLPGATYNFAQVVLLAAMDRDRMIAAFRAMDDDEAVRTLQRAQDFKDWLQAVHQVADGVYSRGLIVCSEIVGPPPRDSE